MIVYRISINPYFDNKCATMISFNWFKLLFNKKIDLPVGMIFLRRGKIFKVKKVEWTPISIGSFVLHCRDCDFDERDCEKFACTRKERKDGQFINFKDVSRKYNRVC